MGEKVEEVYSIFLIRCFTQNKLGAVETTELCKDVRMALILRWLVYNVAKHVLWLQGDIFCMGLNKQPSTNSNCKFELQDLWEDDEVDRWRSRTLRLSGIFSCVFITLEWKISAKIHVMDQGQASIDSRSFQI